MGLKQSTWVSLTVVSMDWNEKVVRDFFSRGAENCTCRIEMEKVAVLPVPDCAWAITSLPLMIGLIARCWMADGFSKP